MSTNVSKPTLPITPARERAAVELAYGATQKAAAAAAGVNAHTVGRWLKDPDYRALVDQYAADWLTALRTDLSQLRRLAVKRAIELISDGELAGDHIAGNLARDVMRIANSQPITGADEDPLADLIAQIATNQQHHCDTAD